MVLAIIFSPVLFLLAIVFVALVIAAIAAAIGGGAILYEILPSVDWSPLASISPLMTVAGSMAGIVLGRYPIGMYCLYYSSSDISLVANGYRVEMVIAYPLDSRLAIFLINLSALGWQFPLYGTIDFFNNK